MQFIDCRCGPICLIEEFCLLGIEWVEEIIGTQQTFLGLVQNGDAKPEEIPREDSVTATKGSRGENSIWEYYEWSPRAEDACTCLASHVLLWPTRRCFGKILFISNQPVANMNKWSDCRKQRRNKACVILWDVRGMLKWWTGVVCVFVKSSAVKAGRSRKLWHCLGPTAVPWPFATPTAFRFLCNSS